MTPETFGELPYTVWIDYYGHPSTLVCGSDDLVEALKTANAISKYPPAGASKVTVTQSGSPIASYPAWEGEGEEYTVTETSVTGGGKTRVIKKEKRGSGGRAKWERP